MSNVVIQKIKDLIAEWEGSPVVKTVEEDVEAIASATLKYIETNGLQALYAIATSVLAGVTTGTSWATIGAAVVSQGEAAGIAIAKGAESIVLAQAQADLIAAGKLIAPTSGAVVTSTPAA